MGAGFDNIRFMSYLDAANAAAASGDRAAEDLRLPLMLPPLGLRLELVSDGNIGERSAGPSVLSLFDWAKREVGDETDGEAGVLDAAKLLRLLLNGR